MNKERIEENRKYVNAGEGLVFDYIEDLDLWIIGGFGPVDIQPDGIKFEHISPSVFPNGERSLLPYITECDAAEGFSVYKFKAPFFNGGRDITGVDIYFIQCTNNGTTYFACSNQTVLHSFVLNVSDKKKCNVKKHQRHNDP